MTPPPDAADRAGLAAEFRRAGLDEGDNVILHSSYKSVGPVRGGPGDVVEAILDVVGFEGHLMVPTFTYCLPMWKVEPFDYRQSKSRVGAVTEAVRIHPRAVRSFHPTHSVTAIGPQSEELTKNHLRVTPIGLDSPFGRMYRLGAKIMMLGTHQDTNSSLHLCEVHAGVPYVNVPFSEGKESELAWFMNERGEIEYTQINEVPGCSRGFRAVEPELKKRGVLREKTVAGAPTQLLELRELVATMDEILAAQPVLLLCETPGCSICPKRRRFMHSHSVSH